jgi:hypothetical protein
MTTEQTALQAGIDFIVPVWGNEYTRFFAEICLPTFLAPGNIPALPLADRHAFHIYTTPDDRAAIEVSPAYHHLARHMQVNFHRVRVLDPTRHANPLAVQSDCYRRAIRAGDAADRAMFFMTPDMIIADGSLRNLAAMADRPNVRAVLGTGVRLVKDTVEPHLLAHHRAPDGAIAIAPRALVRVLLEHMHPMARAHFYRPDEGDGNLRLSNLYWRAGEEGIVARCFHLHPYLVYPRVKNALFTSTVDGDYIESACPDMAETYVSDDSDEFCVCELTAASRTSASYPRTAPVGKFTAWMRDRTTPRHRALITKTLRLHGDIGNAALWQRKEDEANAVVAGLLEQLRAAGAAGAMPDARLGVGYVDLSTSRAPLFFATAIRSEEEARCFVAFAAPSLLAPANLPQQFNKRLCAHRIVATAAARAVTEASSALAELREHIRVDIETRDGSSMHEDTFAAGFRREALEAARQAGAAAVFIEPDMVLSDAGLAMINAVLEHKMRAMLAPCLRLKRSRAAPLLRDHAIGSVLSIGPDELVGLALATLHPLALAQFRDPAGDRMDPSTLCWRVADEGAVVHAFDYHPVVLYPRGEPPAPDAVDHPLLGSLGFGPNEISIIRNSHVFALCQLSDEREVAPPLPAGSATVAEWAATHTGVFQRLLFRNEIRLYATDKPSSPQWEQVGALASAETLRVLEALAHGDQQLRRA